MFFTKFASKYTFIFYSFQLFFVTLSVQPDLSSKIENPVAVILGGGESRPYVIILGGIMGGESRPYVIILGGIMGGGEPRPYVILLGGILGGGESRPYVIILGGI